MYESLKKIRRSYYFLQCNDMQGMFKSENIVVTNGTTHCILKQSSKILSQLKYLLEFTKVFVHL
jgi:hypothetical protein